MRKMFWLVAALAVLMVPATMRAQGGGVYVMGHKSWISGSTLGGDSPTGPSGNSSGLGATFGTYYDFVHAGPIAIGADARYSFSNDSSANRYGNELNYGSVNGRFSLMLKRFVPLHPYVQAGVLEASTNYALHSAMHGGLGYNYAVGADLDFAPHVGVRVEYAGGGVNDLKSQLGGNASLTFNQVQGGLVIWFGR